MERIPWIERKFNASLTDRVFSNIIERVIGTPARIEDKLRRIAPEYYTKEIDGKWSIQRNIGHLLDVEVLWFTRFDELLAGKDTFTPANMANPVTKRASHNTIPVQELIEGLRTSRDQMLNILSRFTEFDLQHRAYHARLDTMMNITDLTYFIAEHDDHHLATMTSIYNYLSENG